MSTDVRAAPNGAASPEDEVHYKQKQIESIPSRRGVSTGLRRGWSWCQFSNAAAIEFVLGSDEAMIAAAVNTNKGLASRQALEFQSKYVSVGEQPRPLEGYFCTTGTTMRLYVTSSRKPWFVSAWNCNV